MTLGNSRLIAALSMLVVSLERRAFSGPDIFPNLRAIDVSCALNIPSAAGELKRSWKSAHDGHRYAAKYKADHLQSNPVYYHRRLSPSSRPPRKGGLHRSPGKFY